MSAFTNFLFRNAVSFHYLHELEARASAPEVKRENTTEFWPSINANTTTTTKQ